MRNIKVYALLVFFASCSAAPPSPEGGSTAESTGDDGGTEVPPGDGGTANATTWNKDVLPIVRTRCFGCHSTGGIGTFSMETYASARAKSAEIASQTASRTMPPWMIDETCGGPYRNSRHLTESELRTFKQWNEQGALEGNVAEAVPVPDGPTGLSQVDLSLSPGQPYTPIDGARDDYHCFVLEPNLTTDKDVVGYDIVPGIRAEVHHVALYTVDRAQAAAKNTSGKGWTCFGGTGTRDQNLLAAWAPGSTAVMFPRGTGLKLPTSKVIVMQIHYNLQNGVRQPDTTQAKLQFASGPVTRASMLTLVDFSFSVPPNSTGYSHSTEFNLGNYKLWGVFGHQHTRGREVKIQSGTQCLFDIPRWDFNWQQQYFYQSPIQMESQPLTLTCTWDNPTNRTLTFGENSDQEMCVAVLYATP